MTKHPSNKLQRRLAAYKKNKFVNEKTTKEKDKSGRVWKRLSKETIQQKEAQDDLQWDLR